MEEHATQHAPASSPPTVAFDKFERNVQARCHQGAMNLILFYCLVFFSCFTRLWWVTDSKMVPLEWHLERTQISLLQFHYMPKFQVGIRIYRAHDVGAIFRRLARILSKRNFSIYAFLHIDLANVSCQFFLQSYFAISFACYFLVRLFYFICQVTNASRGQNTSGSLTIAIMFGAG